MTDRGQATRVDAPPDSVAGVDRILVVEDEPLSREMIVRRLVSRGFSVTEASSAAEARNAIESQGPDLILLDVMLGDENGIDLLRWIRETNNPEQLPVILVTAMIESTDVVTGLDAGANDYVVKPVNMPILMARIAVHLKIRKSATELEARVRARTAQLESVNAALREEIRQRERIEDDLRESEARYQSLAEDSPVGIFHTDLAGRCLYVNRRWCDLAGLSPDQARGEGWNTSLHPDDRQWVTDAWYAAAESGSPFEGEFRLVRPDGSESWIIARAILSDLADTPHQGYVGTVTDISELKARESETQRRQRELIQAEKMVSLGTLVAGVAHEINNPCHVVMSSAQSLQQFWNDAVPLMDERASAGEEFSIASLPYDEARDYVPKLFAALGQSADRIKHIVQELREYSRENTLDLDELVFVNAVVESGITLISNTVRKSTNCFSLDYGADLEPVRGNYRRLEQVVINLVQNACRALTRMDQAITIMTRQDPNAEAVIMEVRDEGVGIAPRDLSRITDPFYTTNRDRGGTGLGLSIAATIVREHGGRLDFQSEAGKGTLARVVLPVAKKAREHAKSRRPS